jgi:hypothetical protein
MSLPSRHWRSGTRSDAIDSRVSTFIRMATGVCGPLSDRRGNGLVCATVLIKIQRGMGYEWLRGREGERIQQHRQTRHPRAERTRTPTKKQKAKNRKKMIASSCFEQLFDNLII